MRFTTGILSKQTWMKRCAQAVTVASVALIAVAAVPLPRQAEASSPAVVPGCGPARLAGGGAIPSALPVRNDAPAPVPAITAQAAAVVDAETGRLLLDLNANERRAPASTTKIMTAILALENVSQDNWTVSDIDARTMVGSSVMGLRPGAYVKMRDLLYGLMLPSGNDAAIEIAKNVDGTEARFVERMNRKVEELGLTNTHFMNPHGLDHRDHYTSAYDLSMIARYAMANESFRQIVATRNYTTGAPLRYQFRNGNSLLSAYPGADGVKIGWTERAGWTLVASAVRDGRRVFVTVLNSRNRNADAAALFDWAFANHHWNTLDAQAARTLRLAQRMGIGTSWVSSFTSCA